MDYKYKYPRDVDRPTLIAIFEVDEIVPALVALMGFLMTGYILTSLLSFFGVIAFVMLIKRLFPRGRLMMLLHILSIYQIKGVPESYKREWQG